MLILGKQFAMVSFSIFEGILANGQHKANGEMHVKIMHVVKGMLCNSHC